MDRLAFRCSANACFMPSEEYPAFSQNSTRGKTRSPIGVFSPSFPSRLSPMALFKRSSASLTLYQDFTPLLVLAHLDVESLPLAHGTAGSEAFFRVDASRLRRSGSHQLLINNEAASALLSTVSCLGVSTGLIQV